MQLTSPAFKHNQMIPKKYTCQGDDVNPPLDITEIPEGAKTLALIIDDPDAPMGMWVHWVVFNIPITQQIAENSIPGLQGRNDFGRNNYGGPCPPSGTHHYYFKLYALNDAVSLKEGINKATLEKAMTGHILDQTELVGFYKK